MCGRTAEKTCYVRGGEADESYGAAEGCGRGCDETGEEVETAVHASGVDTEVLCVGIAKEYGVEWFYVEDGYYEAGKHEGGVYGQTFHGDSCEAAHPPEGVGLETVLGGVELKQGDEAAGDIGDHDTRDEEHDGALEQCGKCGYYEHNDHCACHCCEDDEEVAAEGRAHEGHGAAGEHHDDGDGHVGSAVDAENGWTGKGVTECGLQEQARCGEACSAQKGGNHLWKPAVEDYVGPGGIVAGVLACEYAEGLGVGYVD